MRKTFIARAEELPGEAWGRRFAAEWLLVRDWYLKEGAAARPTPAEARGRLAEHLPELLPFYDRLCALAGDDPLAHSCLSHWNPPRVISGCSQAVWLGPEGPALIRNYDWDPDFAEGAFKLTDWIGQRVLAMSEAGWGCLDGINESGLAVSLTFGGRQASGPGFSILLVLRYLLETCRTVAEGVAVLRRVPVAMAQNVTLLDRAGAQATVFVGYDREPAVSLAPVVTNHQESVAWPEAAAACHSVERQRFLADRLAAPGQTLAGLTAAFHEPALLMRDLPERFVTLYTARYRPAEGRAEILWPGRRWSFGFEDFKAAEHTEVYTAPSLQ